MTKKILGPLNVTGEQGAPTEENNETTKPDNIPEIPSVPSLPGFLLDWHLNLFDILLILFWIYTAVKALLLFQVPTFTALTQTNLDAMMTDIKNQIGDPAYEDSRLQYNPLIKSSNINISTFPVFVISNELNDIYKSINDNFDSNNEFSNMPINKIKGIFALSGVPEPLDKRYEDYNKLKSELFTVTRRLERS